MTITSAEKSRREELRKTLRRGSYIIAGGPPGPVMTKTAAGMITMSSESEVDRETRAKREFQDKYSRYYW